MSFLGPPRLSAAFLSGVLAAGIGAPPVAACFCAQRTLEESFRNADEVFVARLQQVTEKEDRLVLSFDPGARRFKPASKSANTPPLTYVTAHSSASCGIGAEVGAAYAVFAQREEEGNVAWLTICDGTRMLVTSDGQAFDFDDLPLRSLPARLNALAGLQVLEEIAENEPMPDNRANEELVGLLQIPPLDAGDTIVLRSEPSEAASALASVDSMGGLVRREWDYEDEAAVVFAVTGGWYKLRLSEGDFGWLASEHAGAYAPYAELPIRRLAYLNQEWDGLLWPEPGAGSPFRGLRESEGSESRRETPIHVLESQRIGGSLWFRVEVLYSNGCASEEIRVSTAGWVPAYGTSGKPAIWFYSRGC